MNDFVKGMLLTAAPALVLGVISAVGVVNSSGENGILFLFVWLLALLALVVTTVLSLSGVFFKEKKRGRAGSLAGVGIGLVSLGLSCFAMFRTPGSPPVSAPTSKPSATSAPLAPPTSIPTSSQQPRSSPPKSLSLVPALTLGNPATDGLNVTINGVTTPGSPGATIVRIHWVWGDGQVEDRWFPASHVYARQGRYSVTVTSWQSDGRSTSRSVIVPVGPPVATSQLVTRNGTFSGFQDFPDTFFQQSKVPSQDVLKVTDAQYLSLKKMHNGISPYGFCTIEYEASAYGFTTPTGLKLGNAAFPALNGGNPPWQIMAHEQGHNFFGGTSAFYSSIAVPFPFLQESLAVAGSFYVYRDLIDNKDVYAISDQAADSLVLDFTNGRKYQETMFNRYVAEGKRFDVTQVLTSQALDFKMITYGELYGWQNMERLARAFENNLGARFSFQADGSSPVEQSTYIIAAMGAAFGKDFRTEFRDLNFPIDDALYQTCFTTIESYLAGR